MKAIYLYKHICHIANMTKYAPDKIIFMNIANKHVDFESIIADNLLINIEEITYDITSDLSKKYLYGKYSREKIDIVKQKNGLGFIEETHEGETTHENVVIRNNSNVVISPNCRMLHIDKECSYPFTTGDVSGVRALFIESIPENIIENTMCDKCATFFPSPQHMCHTNDIDNIDLSIFPNLQCMRIFMSFKTRLIAHPKLEQLIITNCAVILNCPNLRKLFLMNINEPPKLNLESLPHDCVVHVVTEYGAYPIFEPFFDDI